MADRTEETKAAEKPARPRRKPVEKSQGSGLGIEAMGDLSGLLADPTPASDDGEAAGARAAEISLELIDEDPNQPRTHFDQGSLDEMAGTIALRGVKTPISVRPHTTAEGRFFINHGARRYRASLLAGKTTIPAFVDADYTEDDQVIENIQRETLTPREIAEYIGRRLAAKVKKIDIAKAIGKSPAFVSQHVALLDLPDPIAEIFQSGRCRDVTLINELVGIYKKRPEAVNDWLADEEQEITRGTVRTLREFLESPLGEEGGEDSGSGKEEPKEPPAPTVKGKEPDSTKLKKAIVTVEHDGRPGRLMLNRRPTREGLSWMKYDDDGSEFETELKDVRLISVIEG